MLIIGLVAGMIIVSFIIGACFVPFPFKFDYGDSASCPYDTYSPEDFSMSTCKNVYRDVTPQGEQYYWVGRMSGLTKLNQLLVLYLVIQEKDISLSSFSVKLKLWVRARESLRGENKLLVNGDLLEKKIECVSPFLFYY